ncbi:MAG: deoxyribose-phosphate aldolase [Saprospiraceae bacterium]|nr:deoxyribose-phosphate aldolase [Saprospiraceae bacterium]
MSLASFIDHTILKPDCKLSDIQKVCDEALQYQFAAVCIPPYYVPNAADLLADSPVKVATVIGFPMGYATTAAKVEEIKRAIDEGVDELDVVINLCALKNGQWNFVSSDLDRMITTAHLRDKHVKVIIETGLLLDDEIRRCCDLCKELNADFVKTSTGYSGEGATVKVVQLMAGQLKGSGVKIKASGGIRTKEDALRLLDAGAQRLGCSSSVSIITSI